MATLTKKDLLEAIEDMPMDAEISMEICDAMDIPVSWLLFSSITEEDVPEEKREIFNILREPMIKLLKKMEEQ